MNFLHLGVGAVYILDINSEVSVEDYLIFYYRINYSFHLHTYISPNKSVTTIVYQLY